MIWRICRPVILSRVTFDTRSTLPVTFTLTLDRIDNTTWHPKLRALHDLWLEVTPAPDLLPGRQHIGPELLKRWLPNIWLIDVVEDATDIEGNSPRFRYRLVGTKLVEMRGGHNPMGDWLDTANPARESPNPTTSRMRGVVRSRLPSWRHGLPNNRRIDDIRQIENLFLPLAADGERVNMLLCCSLYFGIGNREL